VCDIPDSEGCELPANQRVVQAANINATPSRKTRQISATIRSLDVLACVRRVDQSASLDRNFGSGPRYLVFKARSSLTNGGRSIVCQDGCQYECTNRKMLAIHCQTLGFLKTRRQTGPKTKPRLPLQSTKRLRDERKPSLRLCRKFAATFSRDGFSASQHQPAGLRLVPGRLLATQSRRARLSYQIILVSITRRQRHLCSTL